MISSFKLDWALARSSIVIVGKNCAIDQNIPSIYWEARLGFKPLIVLWFFVRPTFFDLGLIPTSFSCLTSTWKLFNNRKTSWIFYLVGENENENFYFAQLFLHKMEMCYTFDRHNLGRKFSENWGLFNEDSRCNFNFVFSIK